MKPNAQKSRRQPRLPKDLVLLQLALVLLSGGTLTYARLTREFLLERRTAERYLADLRAAGLPITTARVSEGREASFALDATRAKHLQLEAIDISPSAARSLSLLLVAAALLPAKLGVRDAVDRSVRAALRLRGMKAAVELRRFEDAVIVLENDAKDYEGKGEVFGALLDATLEGAPLEVRYRSPRDDHARVERFYSATIGLYRGGLYTLAVPLGADGAHPIWRAIERIEGVPALLPGVSPLDTGARLRALNAASQRWGPARPRPEADVQVITLHFSAQVAPYVLARPWHPRAEVEAWPASDGGGVRMAIRLAGETTMLESWIRSWGPEVQVLRPPDMAERIAASLEDAAQRHRRAAAAFSAESEASD